MATEFLTYKGRPLVRSGDTLYYGNMADKYVVQLTVKQAQSVGEIRSSSKVLVQLINTDNSLDITKRVEKKSEKGGLYDAMDIGAIWLERALKESK